MSPTRVLVRLESWSKKTAANSLQGSGVRFGPGFTGLDSRVLGVGLRFSGFGVWGVKAWGLQLEELLGFRFQALGFRV